MNRQQAKELLSIIKAYAEDKTTQYYCKSENPHWIDIESNEVNQNVDFSNNPSRYRIKPESKYRPFKSQEECWNEMLKHQPFGWVRSTICDNLYLIESISNEINYNRTFTTYNEAFEWVKFADGTPFGIKD